MSVPPLSSPSKPLPQSAAMFLLDPARRGLVALVGGLVAFLLAWLASGPNGIAASYLAAWICLLALPVGALPVVIMTERADAWRPQPETALLETLRWLLTLMPVAAILVIPVTLWLPELYPWAHGAGPRTPFAGLWFTTPFLLARLVVYFAIWLGLAMLFSRRGGEPFGKAGRIDDGRAVLGLGFHVFVGTLVAADLVMAVAEQYHSTLSGLLLMAAWSGLSLSAAILLAPPDVGPSRRRLDRLTPLAVLLAIWAFLHFLQFLIGWSANLPDAAAWYAARGGFDGRALAAVAGAIVILAALLTLRPGENRTRLVAAAALIVHLLEMSWFVTPSLRGSFKVSLVDLLVFAGIASLTVGLLPLGRWLMPVAPARPQRRTGRTTA